MRHAFYNRRNRLVLYVLAPLIAGLLPVGLSLWAAIAYGHAHTEQELLRIATEVHRRSDVTVQDARNAFREAAERTVDLPACSPAYIDELSSVVAGHNYVGGLAVVRNNQLLCTSFGPLEAPIDLGAAHNAIGEERWWSYVSLPYADDLRFNIIARGSFAALYQPDLAVDIVGPEAHAGIAQIRSNGRGVVRMMGSVPQEWLRLTVSKPTWVENAGYVGMILPAPDGATAAIAAIPIGDMRATAKGLLGRFLLVGIFVGVIVAVLMLVTLRHWLSMKMELRSALRRREFFLLYQPVVDLRSGKCMGAEALIRWRRRDGQMISPVAFIPDAERYGLIREVTSRVLEIVSHDAMDFLRENPNGHIAINFSAADLQHAETAGRLTSLVRHLNVSSRNIIVEATEHGFLTPDQAKGEILRIRSSGFRVAIDDFGTGASSLSTISNYDIDYLKIDKAFVDMAREGHCPPVLATIVGLANGLGLQIIAEGIETAPQRDMLVDLGVDFGQGWLFARPMPMQDLRKYVLDQRVSV